MPSTLPSPKRSCTVRMHRLEFIVSLSKKLNVPESLVGGGVHNFLGVVNDMSFCKILEVEAIFIPPRCGHRCMGLGRYESVNACSGLVTISCSSPVSGL